MALVVKDQGSESSHHMFDCLPWLSMPRHQNPRQKSHKEQGRHYNMMSLVVKDK
jgi:hypothetical protein